MLTLDYKQRIDWVELLSTNVDIVENPKLTHHHSYPQTTGITKIDLDAINHTETQQKSIRQHDAIIKTLMKERSKVVYVSNILHSILEHNIPGTMPVTSYLLLKRILNQIETLKKEISVENLNSKFKNVDQWEEFRMTEEYLTFSRYLNEEHEETVVFLSAFKQEISSILHEINDDYLKAQTLSTSVDVKYLWKLLLEYVENANETIQAKLENKEESSARKLMLHVNEILDCISLEEFFEKILVENTMNLHEQSYFTVVKNYSKEKLHDIIQGKIASTKRKV